MAGDASGEVVAGVGAVERGRMEGVSPSSLTVLSLAGGWTGVVRGLPDAKTSGFVSGAGTNVVGTEFVATGVGACCEVGTAGSAALAAAVRRLKMGFKLR